MKTEKHIVDGKVDFMDDPRLDEFENFLEKTLRMIDYDRSRVKGLFDPLSTNAWKHDFLEFLVSVQNRRGKKTEL